MKETKGKKNTRSITQKAKKIRSIVMMSLLCVLLLSAATYAWFTLSNTAKVSNLSLTVGDVTGLQVAKNNNGAVGTYGASIELDNFVGKLLPATTSDGVTFSKPVYDLEGKVSSVTGEGIAKLTSATGATTEGYYCEQTFYLKSLGKDSTVKLMPGAGLEDENNKIGLKSGEETGTYVVVDATDASKAIGAAAIRVSFTVGDTTTVYAPFDDVEKTGTSAQIATGYNPSLATITASQRSTGSFGDSAGQTSPNMISLEKDTDTLVTVRIWIEGNDEQCANEMQAETIIGQFQFTNADATEEQQ